MKWNSTLNIGHLQARIPHMAVFHAITPSLDGFAKTPQGVPSLKPFHHRFNR
jgi:hypothetical protein